MVGVAVRLLCVVYDCDIIYHTCSRMADHAPVLLHEDEIAWVENIYIFVKIYNNTIEYYNNTIEYRLINEKHISALR